MIAAVVRGLVYATIFIGLVFVYFPARVAGWVGVTPPGAIGPWQVVGLILASVGGLVAVGCVLTFGLVGRGTPAPFDPPRHLVRSGPYRLVRNPMYLGGSLVLFGGAGYYRSLALVGYGVGFLLFFHVFVRRYEEPTLRRLFGQAYLDYCATTPRWLPRLR